MTNILSALFITALFLASDYLVTGVFSPIYFGLFFLLVLFLERKYLLILASLSLIHQLFFSYFQREMTSADIYNFFTHMSETFESFFSLIMIVYKPIIFFILLVILIRPKPYALKSPYKYPLFIVLIMINLNSILGLKILPAFYGVFDKTNMPVTLAQTPLYPQRPADTNIILIIGESMKYDAFVENKLKEQGYFYKKIYAGATNTDVSVPLLINNQTNPLKLSTKNETNLFRLAQKNHFQTTFISAQHGKNMKYIKPYLQLEHINHYKDYDNNAPKFDFLLLEDLQKSDLTKPHFIVLEQIGEHSPYHFFKGEKSTPQENYKRSVSYSFEFYKQVYNVLEQSHKPFVLLYTSDHGEFTGEKGRWGHNAFEKTIYEVPLFITSNIPLPEHYHDINSHHHLAEFITYLLGYHDTLELSADKPIINGTMITREDGFITID